MRKIRFFLFVFILPVFFACNLGLFEDSNQIIVNSDHITLAWDSPDIEEVQECSVTSYKIFYREHSTSKWTLLTEKTDLSELSYRINHKDIGNGEYDFAVSAVYNDSVESSYHTSLDNTADPDTGWYILWLYV